MMVGMWLCHIPTLHHDVRFPPGGNMTGGNMLGNHDYDDYDDYEDYYDYEDFGDDCDDYGDDNDDYDDFDDDLTTSSNTRS